MNATDKKKVAAFLDISNDFLGSGYRSAQKVYQFDDDVISQNKINGIDKKNIDSIENIAEEIKICKNCQLCATRTNAVPGEGVSQPQVLVIGEGPGQDEDTSGRPFVGKAGQLLDKMLASINLSRKTNCFIANVVKCRPPSNRDPHPEETAACADFLERQIAVLKPKFILVAGRISAQTLLKTTTPIGKLRGTFTELSSGNDVYPLLVTYHPAALLRNEEYKRPAWEDLKLLRSKIDSLNGEK
jgi:DNA polymerase